MSGQYAQVAVAQIPPEDELMEVYTSLSRVQRELKDMNRFAIRGIKKASKHSLEDMGARTARLLLEIKSLEERFSKIPGGTHLEGVPEATKENLALTMGWRLSSAEIRAAFRAGVERSQPITKW